MERDLTKGSVFQNIIVFSLPYLLSYFLQTLYGMADLFIVGQFHGVDSITAVSVGSQVMHMLTVMIVGLAMGATVTIGKAVGARQPEKVSITVGNTIVIFMGLSVVIMLLLLLLVKPIVAAVSTPQEAVSGTIMYLMVCFIGIPFITAYNIIGSIFRGLGDSKSPIFYCGGVCGKYFIGLSVYWGVSFRSNGSCIGHYIGTDGQRDGGIDHYCEEKDGNFVAERGF